MEEEKFAFTPEELKETKILHDDLKGKLADSLMPGDEEHLTAFIEHTMEQGGVHRDVFGLNPILTSLQTARITVDEIGLRRDGVIATMLYGCLGDHLEAVEEIRKAFGDNVARIVHGLIRIQKLYEKNPVIESENFRNLLLSFAEDMRVILIMIADRVNIMRQIRDTPNKEAQHEVSEEASYLYAPLAHKLGLYTLKSELEDLSLKYLEHDAYYMIKEKLNATKQARDAYIDRFIGPVKARLEEAGLKFHIKGRTKSIHSIWQKMKKQQCGFEGIYDLFAIRIILDSPLEKEKQQCWQVYSIITDMYQPNPKRLRDWLSVPKSNGYESLHITVLGPENKWVEVQIRTERMDDIAEHGLAAHWRYKGIKSGGQMDEWLANIRSALEAGDGLQVMDQFRMDLTPDEIYAFTPKGDLFKFPAGATVLDFAYRIHSKIGNSCVGGRVNGKVVSMRQELHSGDSVEIITQSNQSPKRDWLNIVKTSKAKSKIRLALKETQAKEGLYAKELLERRFKNKRWRWKRASWAISSRRWASRRLLTSIGRSLMENSTPTRSSTNTWLCATICKTLPRSTRLSRQRTSLLRVPMRNSPTATTTCSPSIRTLRASTINWRPAAILSTVTGSSASSRPVVASRSTAPTVPTLPRCDAALAIASSRHAGAARDNRNTPLPCASSATMISVW